MLAEPLTADAHTDCRRHHNGFRNGFRSQQGEFRHVIPGCGPPFRHWWGGFRRRLSSQAARSSDLPYQGSAHDASTHLAGDLQRGPGRCDARRTVRHLQQPPLAHPGSSCGQSPVRGTGRRCAAGLVRTRSSCIGRIGRSDNRRSRWGCLAARRPGSDVRGPAGALVVPVHLDQRHVPEALDVDHADLLKCRNSGQCNSAHGLAVLPGLPAPAGASVARPAWYDQTFNNRAARSGAFRNTATVGGLLAGRRTEPPWPAG